MQSSTNRSLERLHEIGGGPGLFASQEAPGNLLRRAQQRAHDLIAQEMRNFGLTPRQVTVLMTVFQHRGLSQSRIVQLTGIDRSTIAELVARLVRRGLLSKGRTQRDHRANAVDITETGETALARALPRITRAEYRYLNLLPPERREMFVECLTILAGINERPAKRPRSD